MRPEFATGDSIGAASALPVGQLDTLAATGAEALLTSCCASRRWVAEMVTGRPYGDLQVLQLTAEQALARLRWSDIRQAVDAHPRIGDRATGADRESAWSRQEQSGAATARPEVTELIRRGNLDYEAQFGHVYLVAATGLSSEQLLRTLERRLINDEETERRIVRAELGKIVRLRLAKAFR